MQYPIGTTILNLANGMMVARIVAEEAFVDEEAITIRTVNRILNTSSLMAIRLNP